MTSSRLADADIKAVFSVFDATNSGSISFEEMTFALKALGWSRASDQDVQQVFKTIDPSGEKRSMSLAEFTDLVRSKQKAVNSAEEVHAAFRLFDPDGKGKLSAEDLRRAGRAATGRTVPEALIAEIMRVADTNGDGFLSFDEFGAAVAKGTFDVPEDEAESKEQRLAAARERAASKEAAEAAEAAAPKEPPVVDVIAGVKVTFFGGLVDRQEVRRALVAFGYDSTTLPDAQFAELFGDSDGDADGKLTRDEYCRMISGFGEVVEGY